MNTKKEFLAILLSLCSLPSHSALLLEPRVFSEKGRLEQASNQTLYSTTGIGIDIGYMGNYFLAGMTLERNQYKFDDRFSTNTTKNFDGGGIGTFIGFHFWDRLRIQTTYINTTLEPTDNNNYRYFGQYFAYGIGLRLWQGLMLNLSQYSNQYTQIEDDRTGKTSGLDSNIKTDAQTIGLSYIITVH